MMAKHGRLIDADALIADIREHSASYFADDFAHEWVDKQPTIEPERKKGKWKIYAISMLDGEGCKCSECGFEGAPYWDFCPNCGSYNGGGADMRGDNHESD